MQDVNDNAPVFSKSSYSAVVPETIAAGSRVATVTAADPDLGAGGRVSYEIFDEGEAKGRTTGEVLQIVMPVLFFLKIFFYRHLKVETQKHI